jgi:peptide-methionine (S)-S-oxide reductase
MIPRLVTACLGLALLPSLAPAQDATETPAEKPKTEAARTKSTKADGEKDAKAAKSEPQVATFAGGCFWSMEATFERIPGVLKVVPGYSGGHVVKPAYEEVLTGETGHAESIQVTFDPDLISYESLLRAFWAAHDPTTLNRQGEDDGTNYRSVIFYHDAKQQQAAMKSFRTVSPYFSSPIVTQLVPYQTFFLAEKKHQDFYKHHKSDFYSVTNIVPKLKKMDKLVKSGFLVQGLEPSEIAPGRDPKAKADAKAKADVPEPTTDPAPAKRATASKKVGAKAAKKSS